MMENKKIKVIHLAPLGAGGISKLTVTINKLIDRSLIQFDYLVFRDEKEFMEEEILKLGSKKQVVDTTNVKNKIVKAIKKINWMKELFEKEEYDVVHVDASTPYDVTVALSAKLAGIKGIVLHSHNDNFERSNLLRDTFMWGYKLIMPFVVTDYFAISEKAATFMFPEKILKERKYQIIRNGINTDDYLYDDNDRKEIREKLGIEDKYVLGHVGRFVYQKNHDFILQVFNKIASIRQDAVLLLVGDGELKEEIENRISQMGLATKVILVGTTHDVRSMLLAMDAFIFPSRFEGLGIVAIEAQATGLPIFCADTIVEEVDITECFYRIHGWDLDVWSKSILDVTSEKKLRRSYNKEVIEAGYDIKAVTRILQDYYVEKSRKRDCN